MHQTILVKRKAEAGGKLLYAAERLAETLKMDPALMAGLHPVGIKDTNVREMMLLEAVANLITAVAINIGAMKESAPVSMETPEPEAVPPAAEVPAEEEPAPKKPAPSKKSTRKTRAKK